MQSVGDSAFPHRRFFSTRKLSEHTKQLYIRQRISDKFVFQVIFNPYFHNSLSAYQKSTVGDNERNNYCANNTGPN